MRLSVAGREQQKKHKLCVQGFMCSSITESSMQNHSNTAVRGDSGGLMRILMRAYDLYEVCLLLTEARVLRMADLRQVRSLYVLVRGL